MAGGSDAGNQPSRKMSPVIPHDTIPVQVVDHNSIHVTLKKGGNNTGDSTRTVSADGKTLTVAGTNYPADRSQPYKFGVKYMRAVKGPAGSNPISGSWRIQKVNEDSAGLTTMWKVAGVEVSMSTPAEESWQAKVGGEGSAVKGIYANGSI